MLLRIQVTSPKHPGEAATDRRHARRAQTAGTVAEHHSTANLPTRDA